MLRLNRSKGSRSICYCSIGIFVCRGRIREDRVGGKTSSTQHASQKAAAPQKSIVRGLFCCNIHIMKDTNIFTVFLCINDLFENCRSRQLIIVTVLIRKRLK